MYIMQVAFECKPEMADKLRAMARDEFRKLAEYGPTDEQFSRTLENFKNAQAKQKAKIWVETQKEYDAKAGELNSLRNKYAAMNEAQRTQIAAQIRLTETAFEHLAADKLALEKEIRRLELNK